MAFTMQQAPEKVNTLITTILDTDQIWDTTLLTVDNLLSMIKLQNGKQAIEKFVSQKSWFNHNSACEKSFYQFISDLIQVDNAHDGDAAQILSLCCKAAKQCNSFPVHKWNIIYSIPCHDYSIIFCCSILDMAVRKRNNNCVRILLEEDHADPNIKVESNYSDKDYNYPLKSLLHEKPLQPSNIELFKLLLKHGATLDITESNNTYYAKKYKAFIEATKK